MNKLLLNLALKNSARPASISCQADGERFAVVLKGVISRDFGIGAADLQDAMQQAKGRPVDLYINSPGGDVFEAREMQAIIASHNADVVATVRGLAASAATIVAMSASRIMMIKGSRWMIHNGQSIAMGDRRVMEDFRGLLTKFDAELSAEYAARTGKPRAEIAAMMDAETWLTADEAAGSKFVDEVLPNSRSQVANSAAGSWDLSAYAHAPADHQEDEDPEQLRAELMAQADRVTRLNRSRLALLQARI